MKRKTILDMSIRYNKIMGEINNVTIENSEHSESPAVKASTIASTYYKTHAKMKGANKTIQVQSKSKKKYYDPNPLKLGINKYQLQIKPKPSILNFPPQ